LSHALCQVLGGRPYGLRYTIHLAAGAPGKVFALLPDALTCPLARVRSEEKPQSRAR